jgi:hypothetical protein
MRKTRRQGYQAVDQACHNWSSVVEERVPYDLHDQGYPRAYRLLLERDAIVYLVKPLLGTVFYSGHLTRQNPTINRLHALGQLAR